ncbi:MAG: hypothetical protein U5J95_12275 [Balneolaceae bacterium]|nr:hypothetical protein [Balneolaceae bacterium]
MKLLTSENISNHITDIIHAGTQQHERCMDLTVNNVERLTQPGALDFGGSEFEAAGTESITPQKKNAGDDYGWWKLESGTYQMICNETFSPDKDSLCFITPHEHAQKAGLVINTQILQSSGHHQHDGTRSGCRGAHQRECAGGGGVCV